MRSKTRTLALAWACLASGAAAAQQTAAVSPGSAATVLTIAQRCPTFSWTASESAAPYELAIYRLVGRRPTDEAAELYRVTVPAGSSSWSPPLERCLEFGGRYAWSVRPAGEKPGEWAAPALFSVAEPSGDELARLVAPRRPAASTGPRGPRPGTDEAEIVGAPTRTTNTGGNFFNESVQIAGDLCAGEECSDGEIYFNGTVRVDSDRPSIAFNDSSETVDFPANDWTIQVNDNNVGGDSYFAIVDDTAGTVPLRIDAGSDDDSFRIADGFVDFGGDLRAPDGELTALGVNLASSGEWKQDYEPVDSERMLALLSALPIRSWTFRDAPGVRHIGPVAEDFHAAFSLPGHDPQHLSVTDVNGVALAAIQALAARSEAQQREIEELRRQNERLYGTILRLLGAGLGSVR